MRLTEDLSPEVSQKAKSIFKAMINDKWEELEELYGVDAEKVAYGKAISQAKKEMEGTIEETPQQKSYHPLVYKVLERLKNK
jgi:hypothetical protein